MANEQYPEGCIIKQQQRIDESIKDVAQKTGLEKLDAIKIYTVRVQMYNLAVGFKAYDENYRPEPQAAAKKAKLF